MALLGHKSPSMPRARKSIFLRALDIVTPADIPTSCGSVIPTAALLEAHNLGLGGAYEGCALLGSPALASFGRTPLFCRGLCDPVSPT